MKKLLPFILTFGMTTIAAADVSHSESALDVFLNQKPVKGSLLPSTRDFASCEAYCSPRLYLCLNSGRPNYFCIQRYIDCMHRPECMQ